MDTTLGHLYSSIIVGIRTSSVTSNGELLTIPKKRENVLCSKVCQRKFINTIILSSPRKTIIIEFLFDNPCSSFLQYDYEKCPLNVPEQNCIFCYPLQDVH